MEKLLADLNNDLAAIIMSLQSQAEAIANIIDLQPNSTSPQALAWQIATLGETREDALAAARKAAQRIREAREATR